MAGDAKADATGAAGAGSTGLTELSLSLTGRSLLLIICSRAPKLLSIHLHFTAERLHPHHYSIRDLKNTRHGHTAVLVSITRSIISIVRGSGLLKQSKAEQSQATDVSDADDIHLGLEPTTRA